MITKVSNGITVHVGRAWVALCLALAAHAVDEALTDFLSVYNPTARAVRERLPLLPLPVFSFRVLLAGLIVAVVILLSPSPFAFRRAKWITLLAAAVMPANGLLHISGSFYLGRLMPGVYTAPLLLAASIYLLWAVRAGKG
ncbi:MAG TPA: HXXEE domain-containing protein [Blastocatellia bacterium]|nr:HXXEE domain-containing protein [Blastocatellia bacterium]